MNSAPFTSWDGVEAYFTFADSPTAIGIFLIISVVLTVVPIWIVGKHEAECYEELKKK